GAEVTPAAGPGWRPRPAASALEGSRFAIRTGRRAAMEFLARGEAQSQAPLPRSGWPEDPVLEFPNGDRWREWAPIPIRMILGVGFIVHGWAKWARGPAAFAELLNQVGVPWPLANARLVTSLEIFGGFALLMGAFVAIVSIPLILSMLGAMFTVNIKSGFSAVNTIGLTPEGPQFRPPGYEINLLYIAGLVALIPGGAGPLSIDAL